MTRTEHRASIVLDLFENSYHRVYCFCRRSLAPDMAEDAPEFMLDEDMTISLTGSNPAVTMGDHGMRVESGTLLMSSTSTEDVVVEAGMCMEMGDGDEGSSSEMPSDEPFMPEEEDDQGDSHPFSEMKAVDCE